MVIGGSDAGVSAALRAREMNPALEVTVLVAVEFPNFSICGLPFFHSGEVADWHSLAHRTLPELAGENASGGHRAFAGRWGPKSSRCSTWRSRAPVCGMTKRVKLRFAPLTVETKAPNRKVYYSGAHELRIRVTADRKTRRLLGAQMVGHWKAELAKRIDVFATALYHRMTVDALNDLDLSYTPPLAVRGTRCRRASVGESRPVNTECCTLLVYLAGTA